MSAPFESTMQDVRYALRMLRRTPGFTFFAILTIALCLGANAAIFTLVDGLLLKGAGYPEPERIVQIWERPPGGGRNGVSGANYLDWAAQSQSFEAIAARSGATMSYTGVAPASGASASTSAPGAGTNAGASAGEPQSLRVGVVSPPFFEVFGARAAAGRTFARDEDQPGKDKVTILTHRAWTSLFGGDAGLLNREILLNGERYTVIGIAGAGIYGVLSFVTARRTQELGIRAALGASRTDLMRMVVGSGTIPVLIGIVIGLAGAMSLARFIQALLFETSPLDAINLIAVSALFLSVALAACLVPAWRASRIDPATALRSE